MVDIFTDDACDGMRIDRLFVGCSFSRAIRAPHSYIRLLNDDIVLLAGVLSVLTVDRFRWIVCPWLNRCVDESI